MFNFVIKIICNQNKNFSQTGNHTLYVFDVSIPCFDNMSAEVKNQIIMFDNDVLYKM